MLNFSRYALTMIITVLFILLPPMLVLKGLRHWVYALHVAVMLALSWWKFPDFHYPLWHPAYLPFLLKAHLASITLFTFAAYGWDKRQAKWGGWRIPERTLHALAFVGGTLGALLGSKFFRHKTIKGQFKQMFWAVVILQSILALALVWITPHL